MKIDFQTKQLVFKSKPNNHLVCKRIWFEISLRLSSDQIDHKNRSQRFKSFANTLQDLSLTIGWVCGQRLSANTGLVLDLVFAEHWGSDSQQNIFGYQLDRSGCDVWLEGHLCPNVCLCVLTTEQSVVAYMTRPEVRSDGQTSGWLCRTVCVLGFGIWWPDVLKVVLLEDR